jgi:prefoldin subunit 5
VTEADLVPSGSSDAVPFEADAAIEWLSDRPEDLNAITSKLNEMMDAQAGAKAEVAKN